MSGGAQAAQTSMLQTLGAGLINILDHTVNDSAVGSPATAQYGLTTAGQAAWATINFGTGNYANEWTNPLTGGQGGNYEVQATLQAGTLSAGSSATGSWLALTSNRAWLVSQVAPGNKAATLLIEIRLNAGAVQDSCTIDLDALVI